MEAALAAAREAPAQLAARLAALPAAADALAARLAAALQAACTEVRAYDPALENQSSWFLRPRSQLLEAPLILAVVLPLALLFARGAWPVAVATLPSAEALAARGASPALRAVFARSRRAGSAWALLLAALDAAGRAAALAFMLLTLHYKTQVRGGAARARGGRARGVCARARARGACCGRRRARGPCCVSRGSAVSDRRPCAAG